MSEIRFIEDTGSYAHRTRANAHWAHLTLAFAADLNTGGERLTRDSAGTRYLGFKIPDGLNPQSPSFLQNARQFAGLAADWINENVFDPDGVRLNIAGNGMRTLSAHGISQENADAFMAAFFSELEDALDGYPVLEVRSGGQTGFDEAGTKAANRRGLKCSVLAPQGWRMTPAQGEDIYGQEAFKARFA